MEGSASERSVKHLSHFRKDSWAKKKINISDIEYINSLKGLFYKNPILSLSLAICLFSFAGVPPLIGFFAKQQVLYSSNSAGYFFLSLTAIIVSVISAFYYLKVIKIVYSEAEGARAKNKIEKALKLLLTRSIAQQGPKGREKENLLLDINHPLQNPTSLNPLERFFSRIYSRLE